MMTKKILIAGAGWLGWPLVLELQKYGHDVSVLGQSVAKQERFSRHGIPYILTNYSSIPVDKLCCDVLVICIPPVDGYLVMLETLLNSISTQQIIFTSSTSVYAQTFGEVDEESMCAGNPLLLQAEQLLLSSEIPTAVLRLGGLVGIGRHPAKHFSGKINIPNGNAPVNIVHQGDVIQFILALVRTSTQGVFNVVNPAHPTRKEYYEKKCIEQGLAPCRFTNEGQGKIVHGNKIVMRTGLPYSYSIV